MSGFRHFTVNSPFPFSMPIHLHAGIFREAGPSATGNPTYIMVSIRIAGIADSGQQPLKLHNGPISRQI